MKRAVLIVVVAIVGLTVTAGVAGLLLGYDEWVQSDYFVGMVVTSAYCIPAVMAVFLWDRDTWPYAMLVVFALCIAAAVSFWVSIYYVDRQPFGTALDVRTRTAISLAVIVPVWAVALVVGAALSEVELRGRARFLRFIPVVCVMLVAAACSVCAVVATFEIGDRSAQSRLFEFTLVLTGIAVALTLAVLLIQKFAQIGQRSRVPRSMRDLDVSCPRCHLRQTLTTGVSRCARCRLKFTIDIEEPHCPKCDYLLHNLTQPVCPECGTQLSADEVATEVTPA